MHRFPFQARVAKRATVTLVAGSVCPIDRDEASYEKPGECKAAVLRGITDELIYSSVRERSHRQQNDLNDRPSIPRDAIASARPHGNIHPRKSDLNKASRFAPRVVDETFPSARDRFRLIPLIKRSPLKVERRHSI